MHFKFQIPHSTLISLRGIFHFSTNCLVLQRQNVIRIYITAFCKKERCENDIKNTSVAIVLGFIFGCLQNVRWIILKLLLKLDVLYICTIVRVKYVIRKTSFELTHLFSIGTFKLLFLCQCLSKSYQKNLASS